MELIADSNIYFQNEIYHKMWLGFSDESKISKIQCQFMYPATDMLIKQGRTIRTFRSDTHCRGVLNAGLSRLQSSAVCAN